MAAGWISRSAELFRHARGERRSETGSRWPRGRFGTGKSAAFGIGNRLRITTIRHGKRSKVELSRTDIDAMTSEDAIPVQDIGGGVRHHRTKRHQGWRSRVFICGRSDQPGIIKYIERHLAHWPKNTAVFVNNHECEYSEPPVSEEFRFRPEGPLKGSSGRRRAGYQGIEDPARG